MTRRVDISYKTILFISAFLAFLWILFLIRDLILILFISIILMSALSPMVDYLTKFKVPKGLSIALIYLIIIGVVSLLVSLIITPLASQTANLVGNLPQALERVLPAVNIDISFLRDQLTTLSRNVVGFSFTVFSNVIELIFMLVITFYLLLDKERVYKLLIQLTPGQKEKTRSLIYKIEGRLGAWFRGQITLSLIIGLLSYTLLFLLNVPYALPLGIVAGIMEIIPMIGPIIAAIPAILVALIVSPTLALFVALGYFAIQQAENSFIVPQVMKKAVGLNPLIVIITIAVGGRLLGVVGALLAVPITVVIQILLQELMHVDLDTYSNPQEEQKSA